MESYQKFPVAKKTIILFSIVFYIFLTTILYTVLGKIPLWAATVINTVCCYLFFTPMHEASHGNIKGSHKNFFWIEEIIGHLSGLALLAPFPLFKLLHLRHHSHTNDPKLDPDYWVAGSNPIIIIFKVFTIVPEYYFHVFFRSTVAIRKQYRKTFLVLILYGVFITYLSWHFEFLFIFKVWLLPAIIAFAMLAFSFDWLPHHPHKSQERFLDTRALNYPLLSWPLLYQNYHLIHHLYPRIPFYLYRKAFLSLRSTLEEEKSVILESK